MLLLLSQLPRAVYLLYPNLLRDAPEINTQAQRVVEMSIPVDVLSPNQNRDHSPGSATRFAGNWAAILSPGPTSKSCRANASYPGRQKAQRALNKIAKCPFARKSPREPPGESDGTTPGSDSYSVPVTGL